MADNTILNTGTGGDTVRDLARQAGTIKTQVVQLDLGGATANAEVLITAGQQTMAVSVPVVIASNQTALPVTATLVAETVKVIGTVNVAAAQTIAVTQATAANLNATVVGNGTFVTQSTLAAETTKVIGTVRSLGNVGAIFDGAPATAAPANGLQVGGQFVTAPATLTTGQFGSLQLTAAQNLKQDITTIAGTAPTTVGKLDVKGADGDVFVRQATAANLNATVTQLAITKATQGATGVTTQDLKDAGRSSRTITLDGFAVAATTETLNTMSYSSDNGTATTGTSYTVTTAKRFRMQSIMANVHTITGDTTSATVIVRVRVNNGGAAIVTSPVQFVFALPAPALANMAGDPVTIPIPDGYEIIAGAGIGITTTCPGFVVTTAAPKVNISITGYEY